ncbi:MAG: restriction endonuclease [Sedimentisphaerales bacterium]|nr:restriction endonuclease [Sedimentisphaerales bacterium]
MIIENKLTFECFVPDRLSGKVNISSPYQNYNAKGNPTSYGIDLGFPELHLSKTFKSSDFNLLRGKVEDILRKWEDKYQRHISILHKEKQTGSVDEMNRIASESIDTLKRILLHTIDVNDEVDWDSIKRKDPFRCNPEEIIGKEQGYNYIQFNNYGRPTGFNEKKPPERPTLKKVKSGYGFFSRLFRGGTIIVEYEKRLNQWKTQVEEVKLENDNRKIIFDKSLIAFEKAKCVFEEKKKQDNDALENIKARYQSVDPKAVEEYCDLVLTNSQYPDYFPKNWNLEYREASKMIVLDYILPSPEQLPTIESYKYVKARDEIVEKYLTESVQKTLYESVIYQICIRTIHELFEADIVNAIDVVAFNGIVASVNPATGIEEIKVIISVSAERSKFVKFDLSKIDPKATFKYLKGVAAAKLIDLTPIPPVIKMDKSDKRFIDGREVAYQLNDGVNIAAMNWEDFEHLVREIFEKEFIANGGEVKVTQASSDGGVDAVAFDPDPIRGGKIIIQAKRYTNTVGVSAVRDLYGTVMNEGATKGILVTTSDYGKDSYEFAKDKPITLLNGSNLLALLEKHGHKARINIKEAKKIIKG